MSIPTPTAGESARNVAEVLVSSTSSETSGTVRPDNGMIVIATSPIEIIATASRYHRFRVSV